MKNIYWILLTIFTLNILSSTNVHAFGLASEYLANNTLYIEPGESKDYKVEIQSTEPDIIAVKFELESNITEIINPSEIYYVGGKTPIQEIKLKVSMPKGTQRNKIYTVKYSAIPTNDGNNAVMINFRLNGDFLVKVPEYVPKEKKKINTDIFSLLGAIMLLIAFGVILFMVHRKNQKMSKKIFK